MSEQDVDLSEAGWLRAASLLILKVQNLTEMLERQEAMIEALQVSLKAQKFLTEQYKTLFHEQEALGKAFHLLALENSELEARLGTLEKVIFPTTTDVHQINRDLGILNRKIEAIISESDRNWIQKMINGTR